MAKDNNFINAINDVSFDCNCPNCNKELDITIDEIGSEITCPHCKEVIELKDNGFSDSIDEAQTLIDDAINKMFN